MQQTSLPCKRSWWKGGPGGACRCSSTGEYELDPPRSANVLEQLVAALCEAGNPQYQQR